MSFSTHNRPDIGEDMLASTKQNLFLAFDAVMCKHDDRFVRGYRTIYFIIKSKETNYSFYKLLHALMSFSTHHRPDIVEDMSASTKKNLFYPLTLSCASTMTGLWGYRTIYFIIK